MLVRTDDGSLPSNVNFFLQTDPDVFYQVRKSHQALHWMVIPMVRTMNGLLTSSIIFACVLMMLKFWSWVRSAIKGIDFTVPRLTERTVRCGLHGRMKRGTRTPMLRPVRQHLRHMSLENANGIKDGRSDGDAVIHVYGSSRVRVFACSPLM